MRVFGPDDRISGKTSIAIGKFDGFHMGHKQLICSSTSSSCSLMVYKVNSSESGCLTDREESISAADSMGADYYIEVDLKKYLKDLTPEEFIFKVKDQYNVSIINVGEDFRFGKGAEGSVDTLRELAHKYSYEVNVVPFYVYKDEKVSSSRIRESLASGDVVSACEMLGRRYQIKGKVIYGKEIGRSIDFPTANITTEKFLPRKGVYLTETCFDGKNHYGITNVGLRPTVNVDGSERPNIETHLLGFDGDIYGKEINVSFIEFIRDEKRFGSLAELRTQIKMDRDAANKMIPGVYKPEGL